MGVTEHKKQLLSVRVRVVTVSDTRTEETDRSGRKIIDLLEEAHHQVVAYDIVKDDKQAIGDVLKKCCGNPQSEVVLINGGTGLAERDITFEIVQEFIDKPIPGFGELFRLLSYEEIGSASMLSRATAGIRGRLAIFSMPGSTAAVTLAMTKLILPELAHIVREMEKRT
ncbi:MAG: MogA/MoaB family molybdenum cofactor biosynthesis protein [Solibacillus sp.]